MSENVHDIDSQIEIDIKRTKSNINELIIQNSLRVQGRLDIFEQKFYEKFPLTCTQISSNTIVWALFDVPLTLYAIGINGAAITELHSILERYAIRELSYHLSKPSKGPIVYKILERLTLPYLAEILHKDLCILDSDDVKYAKKLNTLRNSIAHKNPRPISNLLHSGKDLSFLDIDYEMSKIDCVPLFIDSILFMHRLFRARIQSKKTSTPSDEAGDQKLNGP